MSLGRPSMKQDDHEDHNMPAPEHDGVQLAGDVVPLPMTPEKFGKMLDSHNANNQSLTNIAKQGPSGVDTTNLKQFPRK